MGWPKLRQRKVNSSNVRFLLNIWLTGWAGRNLHGFSVSFHPVMEYVGTRHRTWIANMSIALYFGGGCLLLPFMALWISDWQLLSLAMGAPSILVILAPVLIPESARWVWSVPMFTNFNHPHWKRTLCRINLLLLSTELNWIHLPPVNLDSRNYLSKKAFGILSTNDAGFCAGGTSPKGSLIRQYQHWSDSKESTRLKYQMMSWKSLWWV